MKGLGFKTFFSSEEETYKVDIGFNHYIYCPIDIKTLGIKTKKRSRFIIVYGVDRLKVYDLVWKILLLRPLTSYKFRGIKFRHEILKLKVGKKKQFF
jgi:ribosomal protein L6P/L9E